QVGSALQVTPNSPCASLCLDSPELDVSDPNSSNTRNSDITCLDSDYSRAPGNKFKECMTCLQRSDFSQGSESDTMWFLYNLRYTAANCLFNYPNATGLGSTPCQNEFACGPLKDSIEHGIPSQGKTTAYSYCSAANNAGMSKEIYDKCTPCLAASSNTRYLANFFVALEAGCLQQPAQGVLLGLNETVFSNHLVRIVDPATLNEETSSAPVLSTPSIVGVVAGGIVFILIIAATTFICLRKRKNRRTRASIQADFYNRFGHRPPSSTSFQCKTHMLSPRLWPGAEHGVSSPADGQGDAYGLRSPSWKAKESESPYQDNSTHISKKAANAGAPLHHLTTCIPPPPQAHTSPSTAGVSTPSDSNPLSADSVRSTAALLPTIKAYVPAEHGMHAYGESPVPASASTFSSPTSGTGGTPLLRGGTWSEQTPKYHRPLKHGPAMGDEVPPPPPPPPANETGWRGSRTVSKGNAKNAVPGSPVETWEIQTTFAAPPK
ncbi:hypothetical protein N656DRAFT_695378, partial [Canariomyces notabilis]